MANSRPSVLLEQALAAQLPPYAELHCLTNFSFLRGASHPHELVEQAMSCGYSALAITDECSLAGVVRAHTAVREIKQERDRQQKEREDKAKAAQAGASVEEAAKSTATKLAGSQQEVRRVQEASQNRQEPHSKKPHNKKPHNKKPTEPQKPLSKKPKTNPSPHHRQRTQSDGRCRRAVLHTGCARNQPQWLRQPFRTDHASPLACRQGQLSPQPVRFHRCVAASRTS